VVWSQLLDVDGGADFLELGFRENHHMTSFTIGIDKPDMIRKKVLEVVTNLSGRLKEGRIVRNDTLESVRRIEGWFQDLNIFGDVQVEAALGQLRSVLNGTDYEALKDNEALKNQLAGLADQVAAVAGKLDDISVISGNYKRLIDLN